MNNGKYTVQDVYYKLGKVHAGIKNIQGDIEELKKVQEYHFETRRILDSHLVEVKTTKKKEVKAVESRLESERLSINKLMLILAAVTILINLLFRIL